MSTHVMVLFNMFTFLYVSILNKPLTGLGEHAHFKNFGMAFLTLFRIATGDNWNGIMKASFTVKCTKWTYSPTLGRIARWLWFFGSLRKG